MNSYPRIVLAGTQSGIGKTTLTAGLLLALKKRGLSIQPYKCGPDYIDSGFHTYISGRHCRNLDSFLLSNNVIRELFQAQSRSVSFSLIEGVMGLFDGVSPVSEMGSTAHIAKILNSPVILVLDAGKVSRSIAAVALGYKNFDRKLNIAGFILNRVSSPYHFQITRQSIEAKTNVPILGYLPKDKTLSLPERHLGLTPVGELNMRGIRQKLCNLIEKSIDIEKILKIAKTAGHLPTFKKTIFRHNKSVSFVNILVAYDRSFHFYYQDNLDILEHLGVRLKFFSPLKTKKIPDDTDGIYIGGGFPEIFASQLEANRALRREIKLKAKDGLPIYAECGGLMYLLERLIDFKERVFSMVGIFKGSVRMANKLQGLGYVNVESIKDNLLSKKGDKNKAHIFHWSYLVDVPLNSPLAYKIEKPNQNQTVYDGLIKTNVLASYAHLHFASNINFAKNFIKSCQEYKRRC